MRNYDSWLTHDEPGNQPDLPPAQDRVLAHLEQHCRGKQRAHSRDRIASWTGLSDRTVRQCVEQLRRDGHQVGVGEGGGYFLAETAEEVAEIVDSYRRRVESECQTASLLARNWPGVCGLQLVLTDERGNAKLIA